MSDSEHEDGDASDRYKKQCLEEKQRAVEAEKLLDQAKQRLTLEKNRVDELTLQLEKISTGEQLNSEFLNFDKEEMANKNSMVFVTKEAKKLPKLSGRAQSDDDIDVEEWIEDVKSYLNSRTLSRHEQVDYILDHLKGAAKCEVRYRPPSDRRDPDRILQILHEVFSEPDSVPILQERFYGRRQRNGESIHEYSLALMQLYDKVIKKDGSLGVTRDRTLKGKLTEGVRDEHLKRELRRLNDDSPSLTFCEFRDRAIRWLGVQEVKGASISEAKAETTSSEISSWKEAYKMQQQQIGELTKLVSQTNSTLKEILEKGVQPRQRGEPKCFTCHKPGHRWRECPEKQVHHQGKNKLKSPITSQPNAANSLN